MARELGFDEVPIEFRGPAIPLLARRLQQQFVAPADAGEQQQQRRRDVFNVHLVGRAAVSVCREPERWRDWDTSAQSLQHLKQLWHVLVRYGRPLASSSSPASPSGEHREEP